MKPNILYICGGRSFYSASPGRKISEVVKCWRSAGYAVLHVCGGDIQVEKGVCSNSGVPSLSYGSQKTYTRWYKRFPTTHSLVHTLSEWRDIKHDRKILAYLQNSYASLPIGLVWERSSRLHVAGMEFSRQLGIPYVLEWKDHLVDYELSLFRKRALKLEELKNREADFIVVESGVLKEVLVREGVQPEKILVAHNAVDVAEFSKSEAERNRVRKMLGIGKDVVLVGYLGSYAFYHIAVLPGSTDIICPIKVQEYMASLLPTVAPNYACNREVLEDGVTGVLFSPKNAEDLAEKILLLAKNESLRKQMGYQARKDAAERFSWRATWGAALDRILEATAS